MKEGCIDKLELAAPNERNLGRPYGRTRTKRRKGEVSAIQSESDEGEMKGLMEGKEEKSRGSSMSAVQVVCGLASQMKE